MTSWALVLACSDLEATDSMWVLKTECLASQDKSRVASGTSSQRGPGCVALSKYDMKSIALAMPETQSDDKNAFRLR